MIDGVVPVVALIDANNQIVTLLAPDPAVLQSLPH